MNCRLSIGFGNCFEYKIFTCLVELAQMTDILLRAYQPKSNPINRRYIKLQYCRFFHDTEVLMQQPFPQC